MDVCKVGKKKEFSCNSCGYQHLRNKCPAFGKQCLKCGKQNHFSSMCMNAGYRSKVNQKFQSFNENKKSFSVSKNFPTSESENDYQNDKEIEGAVGGYRLDSISISEVQSSTKWHETVQLHNQLVDFKVDTGAETNIIPESVFNQLPLEIKAQLKETAVQLEVYGGFIIKPVGVIKLDITFLNKKISDVDFYVVSSNKCMPLLGLESCRQLQLIISVNSVEHASILSESQFLNKNKDVFSGLGSFPGELSLKVNKRTAIPVSNPARQVPFKLMDKLQKTLDDLESKKIIAKSEPSEWCSNLVILEKKSGDLRL